MVLAIIAILSLLIGPSLVLATDTPIQTSPADNTTITQQKPKLTWQYSGNCPINTNISCFRIELDTSLLFPNPKFNYTNSLFYNPQTLTDGKWYWRVKAKDTSEIWSSWSTVWSFTLQTSTSTPIPSTISSPTPTSTPSPSSTPQPTSTFTISEVPSQINSDQSFNVLVSLNLPNNRSTDYYLSGAFKKADGTRYFGLTKINSSWIKYESSNYLNQYKITTNDSGNWTGTLEVKPDASDTDYKGSGDYIFKVGRYTSSGSGPTWSNESTIKIMSLGNNDRDTASTNSPSSTTNPSTSPSSVKTKTISSSQSKSYDRLVYHSASVAAATTSAEYATPEAKAEVKNQKQVSPMIWVGLAFVLIGIGVIGYIHLKKNAKIQI